MTELASPPRNAVLQGDCIDMLSSFKSGSVDFVLTDPPYLVRYQSRDGKRVHNDDNNAWLEPAFAQIYRVMKPASYCVSFYGWNRVDQFLLPSVRPDFGSWAIWYSASNTHRPGTCSVTRTNAPICLRKET